MPCEKIEYDYDLSTIAADSNSFPWRLNHMYDPLLDSNEGQRPANRLIKGKSNAEITVNPPISPPGVYFFNPSKMGKSLNFFTLNKKIMVKRND